jgi:hypothetical protein
MPYSITTKDGITINNIPDDVAPDADILKQRVLSLRAEAATPQQQQAPQEIKIDPLIRRRELLDQLRVIAPRGNIDEILPLANELRAIEDVTGGAVEEFIEPLLTVGSSMIAEPIAGLAGIGQALNPLADKGAGAKAVAATREALTFKPRTQTGQRGLQAAGETLKPLGDAIGATEDFLGEGALSVTGSPLLATAAASLPTLAGELLGLGVFNKIKKGTRLIDASGQPTKKLRKALDKQGLDFDSLSPEAKSSIPEIAGEGFTLKSAEARQAAKAVKSEIESGSSAGGLAKFKVKGGRIANDLLAEEAIGQGFTEGLVQSIKISSKVTKQKMDKMLKMMRAIKKNERLGLDVRPTDVIGDSVMDRIKFMGKVIDDSGSELNSIARSDSFKSLAVSAKPVLDKLQDSLDRLNIGATPGKKGKTQLEFSGSDISKDRTSQKIIKDVVDLLGEGGKPDALRMHRLKRQLDQMLDFRKKSASGLTDAGKRVVSDIRKSLNDTLRAASPDYARVNDKLSTALKSIDEFDASMASLDIESVSAASGVGTKLKSLLSNNAGRSKMNDALNNLTEATGKLGGQFDDDIKSLVMFADGLDSKFGTTAKTSLAGQTEQAITQAARQGATQTAVDAGTGILAKGVEKALGKNDFNAFESMRELLLDQ